MTDGPFKNTKLPDRWKKYGDDLVSNAKSSSERTERVESAILRDLCTKETRALVIEIDTYVKRLQQDLIPRATVDAIFERHPTTPQSDSLRRFFTAYLANSSLETAWQFGFDRWVKTEASRTQNRLVEHCISARDRGDLDRAKYPAAIERHEKAFAGIDYNKIRDGFFGAKRPAKAGIAKKTGLDDGPG